MDQTKLLNAIGEVNAAWQYVPDDGDSWDVTTRGDCEDYAFSVVAAYAKRTGKGFLRTLLFGGFSYHYVEINKDGHFVLETPHGFVESSYRRLMWQSKLTILNLNRGREPFDFRFKYNKLRVLLRLALT